MRLTTRGRYGLLAMYELAQSDSPVSVAAIAKKQDISNAYLEQLFSSLKKTGLIKSVRGAQGGYVLAKDSSQIKIGAILRALENSVSVTDCIKEAHCGESCNCVSRQVFQRIQDAVDGALDGMTLKDMVQQNID